MRNKIKFGSAFILLSSAVLCLLLAAGNSAASQDQPTIAKDSVQLTPFTFNVYRQNYDIWSWVPRIEFRVNGPIPSGGQLYVEYTIPGGVGAVKFDARPRRRSRAAGGRPLAGAGTFPKTRLRPTPGGQLRHQNA